ncbi:uncharacterized protein LOC134247563, partial [Saccostrea cucullata]|uniref:uncharacterized protein LOC134247563 n=1 Tax=Saccostrea cuccullata TaxID=36930 RepID=UPI002ED54D63
MSKKQACPATIRIRAIMKFPDFKVDSYNNKLMKRKISRNLKQAFANRDTIQKSLVYLVSYPSVKDHKNHLTGEFAGFIQCIDPRLVTRIKELVADGVRNVSEMKRHLLISVKNDLCPDEDIPRTNRRFFPLDKDIKNHMDIAINSLRFSKDDQLNLESLVETWQESNPEDNIFLRTSYDTTTHGDIPSEDFLFVHQTTWQKRLLNLYGRDICIMDATYKTSKYALPLFFICMQTNVGHSICGSFVVATETKKSIQEGLKKIKEWNPGWNPSYFMTDYDEREIQAVEEVFEDCTVYLCSFHREQSWTRWLKQIKHGVGSNQDEVIELMRGIANANSATEYKEAVDSLKESIHWLNNQQLRKWFDKQWLSVSHRWVKTFREKTYNIRMSTTNGLERKHQEFKRGYLSHYSEGSLCTMIATLVSNFLPDSYRSYLNYNIQSFEFCKKYSSSVPKFLHNKPRMLVEHCIKRIPPEIQNIPIENIQEVEDRAYAVHSVDSNNIYRVMFSDTEPTCTCLDYSRHHLPCKHMLAVMMSLPECSWDNLPDGYKTCPHFTLDQSIMQQCIDSIPDSPNTSLQDDIPALQDDIPALQDHIPALQDDIPALQHDITNTNSPLNQDTSQEKSPEKTCPKQPDIPKTPLRVLLQTALGGLKDIQSDLYLINDRLDLQEISTKIRELKLLKASKIKKDSGLPLNATDKRIRPSLKRKSGNLPVRKKYRKLNKKHCVQFAEEDDVIIVDGTYDMHSNQHRNHENHTVVTKQSMAYQNTECPVIDVDTLWRIKPSDCLVARIGSFKVTDTSIGYLKTSLSDEVIDAYLYLLTQTKKNKKLLAIDSSVATHIFQGISENFHGFMTQTKFSSYDMILAAVNENNSHWTLIVVYPSTKKLVYINPLGELKRTMKDIGDKWRKVNEISEDGWKVETTKHTKQYDSNSCGVYVVKFAELVISDLPLTFSCRPDNLYQIRQGIGNQLLQATEPLFEHCRACSLHREARQDEDWIGCEKCDKFFHYGCIGVSSFICGMCSSLDQRSVNLEPNLRKDPPK